MHRSIYVISSVNDPLLDDVALSVPVLNTTTNSSHWDLTSRLDVLVLVPLGEFN